MSARHVANNVTEMEFGAVFQLKFTSNSSNASASGADDADDDRTLMRWVVYNMDLYLVPIIICVGVVGNGISFCVFILTPIKLLSSSVYLAALSLTDNGFLLCVFFGWLVNVDFSFYQHQGLCQTFIYLTYVFGFLSVWYVVCFTVERYIAVRFPFRRSDMCTARRAKIVVVVMAAFALLMYNPMLWASTVDSADGQSEPFCHIVPEHESLVEVFNYVDTVVTLILPSITIIVMNTMIVHHLVRLHKRSKEILTITDSSDVSNSSERQRYFTDRRTGQNAQITRLLLVVSTIFLLLNLPSHVLRIHLFIMQIAHPGTQPSINYQQLKIIFQYIYYLNFCINFVLYSLCGKNFRRALKLLCTCRSRDHQNSDKMKIFRGASSVPRERIAHSLSHSDAVAVATTAIDDLVLSDLALSEREHFICLERNNFTAHL